MRRKELTIFNVRRSNHETQEALELLLTHDEGKVCAIQYFPAS